MKIARIVTKGVRGVRDGVLDLRARGTDRAMDVVLVTGGPASGKTSLLEAIVAAKEDVAAYGPPPPPRWIVRPGAETATVEIGWELSAAEMKRSGSRRSGVMTTSVFGKGAPPVPDHDAAVRAVLGTYEADAAKGKVEYFHAERALPRERGAAGGAPRALSGRGRLVTSNEKYRGLRAWLVNTVRRDATAVDEQLRATGVVLGRAAGSGRAAISRAVSPFLPGKVFDGVDADGDVERLRFLAADGSVLDLDELSSSERAGVLFAATFLRAMTNGSVILIDGPELHVHPREHAGFLRAVLALGQDNQIIAATTSAALLGAARAEQIIDLSTT